MKAKASEIGSVHGFPFKARYSGGLTVYEITKVENGQVFGRVAGDSYTQILITYDYPQFEHVDSTNKAVASTAPPNPAPTLSSMQDAVVTIAPARSANGCECGSHALGYSSHSSWCALVKEAV